MWNKRIKRALSDYVFQVEKAFCPEPGVLLVRWKVEWSGAFNLDAAILNLVEVGLHRLCVYSPRHIIHRMILHFSNFS